MRPDLLATGCPAWQVLEAGVVPSRQADTAAILLTDGRQTEDPESALRAGPDLRANGVNLHVVGLGDDVDLDYLLRLAGDAAHLHIAPQAEDLAAIYAQLATAVRCGPF